MCASIYTTHHRWSIMMDIVTSKPFIFIQNYNAQDHFHLISETSFLNCRCGSTNRLHARTNQNIVCMSQYICVLVFPVSYLPWRCCMLLFNAVCGIHFTYLRPWVANIQTIVTRHMYEGLRYSIWFCDSVSI